MSIETTTFCDGCHANLNQLAERGHRDGCTINGRHSHEAELPLARCYFYQERRGMDRRQRARMYTKPQRWTFASLDSGYERTCDLYLYPELDCSSMVEEFHEETGRVQLDEYVRYLRRGYSSWLEDDAVPICWFVMSGADGICEAAPQYLSRREGEAAHDDFLSNFTWPVNAETGSPLDWFALPVVNDRFPEFVKALAWTPSPLQPTCPLSSILRSRARRGPNR